jgi:hypothetical protein
MRFQIAHCGLKSDCPFADIEFDDGLRVRRIQVSVLLGGSGHWPQEYATGFEMQCGHWQPSKNAEDFSNPFSTICDVLGAL